MKTGKAVLMSVLVAMAVLVPRVAQAPPPADPGLAARVAALEAAVATLQAQMATAQSNISTLQTQLTAAQSAISTLQANNALALAPYVSVQAGEINGLGGPHVIFTGANVHLRSGSARPSMGEP